MRFCGVISGFFLAALLGANAFAQNLSLRPEVEVNGNVIRLSHLIEGLPPERDIAVFQAPPLGGHGTIQVDRVELAAKEYGINGLLTNGLTQIVIKRPSRPLQSTEVKDAVLLALKERNAKGEFDIKIDEAFSERGFVIDKNDVIRFSSLVRDPVLGRFEARATLALGEKNEVVAITGSALEMRDVLVTTGEIARGEVLQANNLTLVRRPIAQVQPDSLTKMADLMGMMPRRTLKAGEVIRQADIARPLMVEKGQVVLVVYTSNGLNLSMRARAQASGAKGETIQLQNTQSKRFFEGTISGLGQVSVLAGASPQQGNLKSSD